MRARMIGSRRQDERTLWLWWVLAHALYGALGPAIVKILEGYFLAGSATRASDGPTIVVGVTVVWLILGSLVQWWILRKYLAALRWWPVATSVGAVIAEGVVFTVVTGNYTYRETFRSNVLIFGFTAAAIGAAQWTVLRSRIPNAGWWVATSAFGGALIWPAYTAVATSPFSGAVAARGVDQAAVAAVAAQGAVSAAAYALVTAFSLVGLLRQIKLRVPKRRVAV